MLRTALLGFIAGALGVLIFHQGFVAILHVAGGLPIAPYSFAPTHPFNVPQVLSLAFWGGVWGIEFPAPTYSGLHSCSAAFCRPWSPH